MIPTFLRSLAALIRQLIANGKAVHVTEQTAKEMELLAGLPWPDGIAPADIALGWLIAGHECSEGQLCDNPNVILALDRAAVCSELAVMATILVMRDADHAPNASTLYDGTRKGARLAWTLILGNILDMPDADIDLYSAHLRELPTMH